MCVCISVYEFSGSLLYDRHFAGHKGKGHDIVSALGTHTSPFPNTIMAGAYAVEILWAISLAESTCLKDKRRT